MKKYAIKIILKTHKENVLAGFEKSMRVCKYIEVGCHSLLPWIVHKY